MGITSNDTRDFATAKTVCCNCFKTKEQTKGLRFYFGFNVFVCDDCYLIVKNRVIKHDESVTESMRRHYY